MRQSVSEVKWAGIKSGEPSKNNESGGAAMTEAMRHLRTATSSLHRNMKDTVDTIGIFLVDAFHFLALFAIGATTFWSAAAAFFAMAAQGCATLGDILLLFIYLEIGAMIGIYFKTTRLPVRYLI
jgi:protein PsiE